MSRVKQEVRIPFEHLNFSIQRLIKREEYSALKEYWKSETVEGGAAWLPHGAPDLISMAVRGQRLGLGLESLTSAGFVFATVLTRKAPVIAVTSGMGGLAFARWAAGRGRNIQRLHEKIKARMAEFGVLQTEHEGRYPLGWINPVFIAKTHPVFHVEPNGDLVFHRDTRQEYLRWKVQNKFKTSAGWWWREYLRPPKAPQPVKEWADAKMKAFGAKIEKLKPKPRPALAPAPAARSR